jgi:hypothetical protein
MSDEVMAPKSRACGIVYVTAGPELVVRLKRVAKRNRRSMSGEAIIAIERHVEAEEASKAATNGLK